MARTPDRRPGESDEEGIVLENRASGDTPSIAGGIRFVNGAFSFRDSLGLFNPRSQLSAAGDESEIQFNYLGFLSASADLRFIGSQRALVAPALSGSLTRLSDGSPYMLAGGNVLLSTGSNGSITISTITSGTITGITPGLGLTGGGSEGSVTLGVNDSVVATLTGSTFTGAVRFNSGLTGSLTRLPSGSPYLVGTPSITLSTGSNGSVSFTLAPTGSAGTYGSVSAVPIFTTDAGGRVASATSSPISITLSQVTGLTASLADRALITTNITAGLGLTGGGNLSADRTLAVNDSVVATLSGSTFTGAVRFNGGLTGSLTRLPSGDAYLVGGSSIIITTGSNGAITIDAVGGSQGGSLVDGYGTPNYVARWSDTNTLGDSIIHDGSGSIGIGTLAGGDIFTVSGSTSITGSLLPGLPSTFALGSTGKRWLAFLDDLNAGGTSTFGGNLLPDISNNYDIGIPGNIWRNIHAFSLSGSLTGSGLQRGSIVFAGSTGGLTGSVSQIFWDDANSRLGIGTSSPDAPLEVFGVSGSLFSVTEGLSGSLFYVCGVSGVPILEVFSDNRIVAGGGWNSPAFTVTGSRVAIGTTSATDTLTVLGTLALTGSLLPGSTSTGALGSTSRPWRTVYGTALSGSLTKLLDGSSYLVAGAGISITTGSNGAITIVNDGTVGDITAITAGTGLTGGGTTGPLSLAIDDSVVATLSGSTFSGAVRFNGGLSGSLTRLSNGSPYLTAGNNVTITTGSNGSITIGSLMDGAAILAGSNGQVQFNDGGTFGASSSLTFNKTTGALTASSLTAVSGITGSLTQLPDGSPYLVAGTNVIITTGSNGAITIEAALSPYTTASFTNVTQITVNHSIGLSLYDIEVFDSNREKMIPKSAVATSPTQADITFSIPTSGYVIVGGPGALGGSNGGSSGGGGTGDLTSLTTNISTTGEITGSAIASTGTVAAGNPFYLASTTITTNYTVPAGFNALTPGPITIADGASVTVSDGSTWTVV